MNTQSPITEMLSKSIENDDHGHSINDHATSGHTINDHCINDPDWLKQTLEDAPHPDNTKHKKHRSIWISDVHLGTKGSKADFLCDFLKHNDCETLYLVGDIIDGWRMKKKAYWPQAHINVIRRILTRSKRGTKVVYVTGNHDDFLRRYSGMTFGNIHLVDEYIHKSPET